MAIAALFQETIPLLVSDGMFKPSIQIANHEVQKVAERDENGRRTIDWRAGTTRLKLVWDATENRAVTRTANDQPVASSLRYDSPLIRLADGELPAATLPQESRD